MKFPLMIFALILIGVLSGCVGGAIESDVPDSGRVTIDISANAAKGLTGIPRRAYAFPPLLMDANGVPLEQYTYTVDDGGDLVWSAPSPASGEIQKSVKKKLEDEGYELLSFRQFQNEPADHAVLVVTSYYTKHWENKVGRDNQEAVHVVFVRLAGATFPANLEPTQKIDLFNQELLAFYNPADPEMAVVKLGFRMAVKYIGENEHWMFYPALPHL